MQKITTYSPGRINIIGEHTDYNDGFVLPAAIDKKVIVELQRNGDASQCNVIAKTVNQSFFFDLKAYTPLAGGWQNYVMGVVNELEKLGGKIEGFDAQFSGDVPLGSGMSSSAALECTFAYALNELFELGFDKWQLIKASQMAEHNFVGTKCGIMDQFASVMGKKDHVMLLDCRSLEFEYFPLELGDYQLLLLNTNVSHSLADSAYNERRSQCEAGVKMIQARYSEVSSLRDVTLEQLQTFSSMMPSVIFNRCKHVVGENDRVLAATQALKDRQLDKLGELMYASHDSLQNDYEVSCEELDFLVEKTRDKDFVLGSRMMGGGFGGCTINLIEKKSVAEFVKEVSESYRKRFDKDLSVYEVAIGDGAGVL